jgi:hypothetical protein
MFRALTIVAAVVALTVSAAPASAVATTEVFELNTVLTPKTPSLGTKSGGEVISGDVAKAPAAMRLTSITDGTSNTMGIIAILIG